MVAVGEAAHVADVGQDPGGAGGSDPGQVHQVRPGCEHRLLQFRLECLELGVESDQVGELVGGQPPHGAPNEITGTQPSQHRLVLRHRLLHRDPAGNQLGHQPV